MVVFVEILFTLKPPSQQPANLPDPRHHPGDDISYTNDVKPFESRRVLTAVDIQPAETSHLSHPSAPAINDLQVDYFAMLSTHPLQQLPEILNMSQYVQASDRFACALVSKAWHQVFNPLIWRDINLTDKKPNPPEVLQNYSLLVKTLSISCTSFKQQHAILRFPHLVELELSGLNGLNVNGPDILQWITQHSTVSQLTLRHQNQELSPSALWDRLLELPQLKCLDLFTVTILNKDAERFWRLCTRLERLYWKSCITSSLKIPPMNFPFMKAIDLHDPRNIKVPDFMKSLQRCPGLEVFTWRGQQGCGQDASFRNCFVPLIARGTVWPRLERLSLKTQKTTDEELYQIIRGMKKIVRLSVGSSHDLFGPNTMQLLQPHFPTLTELNLGNSNSMTSAMAQDLLSHRTRHAVGKQQQHDECDGSRDLVLLFVARQVQGASGLDVGQDPEIYFPKTMKLSLDRGLGKLSSLRLLLCISFINTDQNMNEREIDWMLEHWKDLRRIHGELNTNNDINSALKRRLVRSGIRTRKDDGDDEKSNEQLRFASFLRQVLLQGRSKDHGCALKISSVVPLQLNVFKPVMIKNTIQSIHLLSDACVSFTKKISHAIKTANEANKEGTTLKEAAISLRLLDEEQFKQWVLPELML
ncbi:hypothetical protein BGZ65_009779 [Modicella reniformis]|uniref:Fumarase C C-terminal domain-containing protein n=1 Tax=Modicella reniformis TaxID=1440133 RepID=A0A9P6MKB1_9FUNG|nr:hypothetical protein BGZ65_009779 [Modicella reniformis]